MKKILILSKNIKSSSNEMTDYFNAKFEDEGLDVKSLYKNYPDTEIYIDCDSKDIISLTIEGEKFEDYDLILFRSGQQTSYKEIAYAVTQYAERNNIKTVNSLYKKYKISSKLGQMIFLAINGMRVPKTVYIPREKIMSKISYIQDRLELPVIMKSNTSHLGKDNHLLKSFDEISGILEKDNGALNYIFQEFIPNSFDYRILVLDRKYVGSGEKRIRKSKDDHRNNVKLGADEEFINPENLEERIKELSIKAANLLNIEVCGVDIIQSDFNNDLYILELNPSPGITFDSIESDSLFEYLKNKVNE